MITTLQHSDDPTLDQLSTLQLPTLPAGTPYLLKSLADENIVETYPGDTHSESRVNQPLRQLINCPVFISGTRIRLNVPMISH